MARKKMKKEMVEEKVEPKESHSMEHMEHNPNMEHAHTMQPDKALEDWQVEDMYHTLKKAHKIKSNPSHMEAVSKHMSSERDMLDEINPKGGIKAYREALSRKAMKG